MESFLWPLVIFHAVVGVVGLPGNALIILVYGRKRQMTSPQVFILALAVADLVVCLFTPVTIYHWSINLRYTSDALCRVVLTVTFATVYNSCFLTTAIALDRYFAICRPHRRWMTPRRAKLAAVLCLILAAIFVLPVFATFGVELGARSGTSTCTFSTATPKWVRYLMFTLIYVAPMSTLVTNTVLYGRIYLVIRKQAAVRPGQVRLTTGRNPVTELDGTTLNSVPMTARQCGHPPPDEVAPSTSGSVAANARSQAPNRTNAPSTDAASSGAPVSRGGPGSSNRQPANAGKFHAKTTKMLLVTTVVYFSTWLVGVGLLSVPVETQDAVHSLHPVGSAFLFLFRFVFYVNNAINPFVYGFVNRRFVEDCKRSLAGLGCRNI